MSESMDKAFSEEAEISKGKLPILEKIVYDFVTDCRRAIANNEHNKFINLVEVFISSFPYETSKFVTEMDRLNKISMREESKNRLTHGRRLDPTTIRLQFAMQKYNALTHLLKDKNMYPKPGEQEEF